MIVKSKKLTDHIFAQLDTPLDTSLVENDRGKNKVDLFIYAEIKMLIRYMRVKELTAQDLANMIMNQDNPKTMDYYFMNLLDVRCQHLQINVNGALTGSVVNHNSRVSCAFDSLRKCRDFVRGQIYFVLDIHENQIFPKSRSFKICGRRQHPVNISNPRAGQQKTVIYNSVYSAHYTEPNVILVPKHMVLYCRNAWERKGEVKPSRAKDKKEDAIGMAVSVI